MKKKFTIFIALLSVLILCAGTLGACTPPPDGETTMVYTVRFHDNYKGDYAKAEAKEGKTVTIPTTPPTRTGFEFKGWFLSNVDDASDVFDPTTPVTGNQTVYAKWQRETGKSLVTLKYLNYRDQDSMHAVSTGTAFAKPADPVYDENNMYTFDKWYSDAGLQTEYAFSSNVNSDITLYAGWIKAKVSVKFDSNYPGSPKPVTKITELGGNISVEDAVRSQYEFLGWFTARFGGLEFDGQNITEDKTIYAHWSRSEYNVVFNANGADLADGIAKKYVIKTGVSAEDIAEDFENGMTYIGHTFEGWFKEEVNFETEEPAAIEKKRADLTSVTDDLTIYAGWSLTIYEISFDYDYTGAPAAPENQRVKYGRLATAPQVADREGYLFGGWFLEKTHINQFTFEDTAVSSDQVLYAKWIEDTPNNPDVIVTYMVKTTGNFTTHATKTITFNGTAGTDRPADPTAANFAFAGWFEDAAYTKAFSMSKNLTANATVYAKMLKKNTFEAEAIDFEGKKGQGTSTNSFEEGMIMSHLYIEGGTTTNVSNGYFVRELYYNGARLDFIIESSEAITDGILYLRVSSESYAFFGTRIKDGRTYNYLTDTEYKIIVNGQWETVDAGELTEREVPVSGWLNYGGLHMPMGNLVDEADLSKGKTPFEDMLIVNNLKLRQGTNLLTLYVDNNKNHGGTFHAESPIVDCIYIYTTATLTMHDYQYYTRPNVVRE